MQTSRQLLVLTFTLLLGCFILHVNFGSQIAAHEACSSHRGALTAHQQGGPDISQLSLKLQSQWDHEQNAHLGSIVIKPQSQHNVHWTCVDCPNGLPHAWQTKVQLRSKGTGCPFCSGHKVCSHNALATIAPEVAMEWDTAKNADSPLTYTARSHHRALGL